MDATTYEHVQDWWFLCKVVIRQLVRQGVYAYILPSNTDRGQVLSIAIPSDPRAWAEPNAEVKGAARKVGLVMACPSGMSHHQTTNSPTHTHQTQTITRTRLDTSHTQAPVHTRTRTRAIRYARPYTRKSNAVFSACLRGGGAEPRETTCYGSSRQRNASGPPRCHFPSTNTRRHGCNPRPRV